MIRVHFDNGKSADIATAKTAEIGLISLHEDVRGLHGLVPPLSLVCKNAAGEAVAAFLLTKVVGYEVDPTTLTSVDTSKNQSLRRGAREM